MNNELFSKNLRRLRLEKKLTRERLANALVVSVQSVSHEAGRALPGAEPGAVKAAPGSPTERRKSYTEKSESCKFHRNMV